MATKLTPAAELRAYWAAFCDADPYPEDFPERMDDAGLIDLRDVTDDDLEDAFAAERGIEPGGQVWVLTASGLAALAEAEEREG